VAGYRDVCRDLSAGVGLASPAPGQTKGQPVRLFQAQAGNRGVEACLGAVDCRGCNALSVAVYVGGANPSARIRILGADEEGANYLPLDDPNSSRLVTANTSFDCVVGTAWAKAEILEWTSGSFTVVATPYVSPGVSKVTVSSESSGDGTYDALTTTAAAVGPSSTLVLAANASRQYLLLQNVSDADIWINLGAAAAVNDGLAKLRRRTGSYEASLKLGNLWRGAVYAIHAATGFKTLLVSEGV